MNEQQYETTIRRIRDGRWMGVISLGTIAGKRQTKTVFGSTESEARRKATRVVSKLQKLDRERDRPLEAVAVGYFDQKTGQFRPESVSIVRVMESRGDPGAHLLTTTTMATTDRARDGFDQVDIPEGMAFGDVVAMLRSSKSHILRRLFAAR